MPHGQPKRPNNVVAAIGWFSELIANSSKSDILGMERYTKAVAELDRLGIHVRITSSTATR